MQQDFRLDGPLTGEPFANAEQAAIHHARHRHPSRGPGSLGVGWSNMRGSNHVVSASATLAVERPGWQVGIAFRHQRTGEWHVSVDNPTTRVQLDAWADSDADLVPACQRAIDAHLVPA